MQSAPHRTGRANSGSVAACGSDSTGDNRLRTADCGHDQLFASPAKVARTMWGLDNLYGAASGRERGRGMRLRLRMALALALTLVGSVAAPALSRN